MSRWSAGYSVVAEIARSLINDILASYIGKLRSQLTFSRSLGRIGGLAATLDKLELLDFEDPAPVGGGVHTDVRFEVTLNYRLLFVIHGKPTLVVTFEEIAVDLPTTNAGLPRGVAVKIERGFKTRVTFRNARGIAGWLLNTIIAPVLSLGIWLAFTVLRKVEIPIWPLVDVFHKIGLSFAPGSPLLTALRLSSDNSLVLASDFTFGGAPQGVPTRIASFLPVDANVAAVVHERAVAAAVDLAFAKGWVPSRFKVKKWKIYINSFAIAFTKGTIEASGTLKAKRKKCWCRVKARIRFRAAIRPRIIDEATAHPKVAFTYDADVNTKISCSGMLVVLGSIMFAPTFMSLTVGASFLINILLNQFMPFRTEFKRDGLILNVYVRSVGFSGFIPLMMRFPLTLTGDGTYDLGPFLRFDLEELWGVKPYVDVGYKSDTISIAEDELRLGVRLTPEKPPTP